MIKHEITIPITVILIILVLSCQNQKLEEDSKFFKRKYSIKGETLIPEEKLLDPSLISMVDTFLIVGNYKGEPLIEIYGKSGVLVKKMLSKGKGPFEVLMIGDIQNHDSSNSFFVNDLFARKILKYNIEECIDDNSYKPTEEFSLYSKKSKEESEVICDKIIVGEGIYIGESKSPLGRVALINKKGELMGYHVDFPPKENVDENLSELTNAALYGSALALNPEGSKLAMATYAAGIINFFNVTFDSIEEFWSFNEFYPTGIEIHKMGDKYVPVHTKETMKGYLDVFATKDFVYALFAGKKVGDDTYKYGDVIRVINWKTNESFELKLDRMIKRLTVDKNDNYIYGTSINEQGAPEILAFDISSI